MPLFFENDPDSCLQIAPQYKIVLDTCKDLKQLESGLLLRISICSSSSFHAGLLHQVQRAERPEELPYDQHEANTAEI
jgi:hypothetical protein